MKTSVTLLWRAAAWCSLLIAAQPVLAQGTAFTYQGFLSDQGAPANAIYDLRFTIYADAGSGTVVAGPVEAGDAGVSNGLFTLTLDFGANVFDGSDRWLEIGVRPGASTGAYTTMAPLQKVTATPYAIHAAHFSGPVAASQITGTLAASTIGAGTIASSSLAPGAAAANLNSSGQSGVASGGLVLSATENNAALVSAGYIKIGATTMSDTWLERGSGLPPAPRRKHTAVWTGSEMIVWGGDNGNAFLNDSGRYDPALNTWKPLPTGEAPAGRAGHTAISTGTEMIIWGGASGSSRHGGARYNLAADSWTAVSTNGAPAARSSHTAVWTGTEMIVWGGNGQGGEVNDGGRYNPVSNSWRGMVTATGTAPTPRRLHTAVWTGSEMIVWGGGTGGGIQGVTTFNDGARYNPSANSWTPTPTSGTPAARYLHTAVWTGSQMIVWGGVGVDYLNDGGRYDPAADSWTAVSTNGAPAGRTDHTAVWTGARMIVFGGYGESSLSDGARYDPGANSWTATADAAVPRFSHTAVWTGSEMLVWGGSSGAGYLNDGERYNPATDSWARIAASAPAGRRQHTAIWTGSEMIVWGGEIGSSYLNDGGRYNPAGNSWTAVATTGAPSARSLHTTVWTGSEMIVWGGFGGGYLNDGGRYNPAGNSWTLIMNTLPNTPTARRSHTSVWTGSEMIVWGGYNTGNYFNEGGRYNPTTNSWTPILNTLPNTPDARFLHTAVWTGSEMIVWGGFGGPSGSSAFNDGGRYDPTGNTWTLIVNTLPNTPAARYYHTAVWTGSEMIVWGGSAASNDGGRYYPAGNTWTAVSTTGAPAARRDHTAVWTGSEMIVWGGHNDGGGYFPDGGRYSTAGDRWTAVSTSGAPAARSEHTAVWTGSEMIVWGGIGGSYLNDTFSYTPGRVLYLYQRP
jgi:N-acetylneuraminic acid mutarotase